MERQARDPYKSRLVSDLSPKWNLTDSQRHYMRSEHNDCDVCERMDHGCMEL